MTADEIRTALHYNRTRGYTKAQFQAIQEAVGLVPGDKWVPETIRAIAAWQGASGLRPDGKVGPKTYAALDASSRPMPVPTVPAPIAKENVFTLDGVKVFDLRSTQPDPPALVRGVQKCKVRNGKVVRLDVSKVTGITLHQTASNFSATRFDAAKYPDPHRALAERAKGVACHVMAFEEGFLAWPNPLDWYVYHGNGLSSFELGIEIEGDLPGLERLRKPDQDFVTDKLVKAGRAGMKLLVERGRAMGMPIEFVHAHRQSSPTRKADPGETLWHEIVLGYAVPVLGLKTEPARIWISTSKKASGPGRPIPREWDPSGLVAY